MSTTGVVVRDWPLVVGIDAAGVVVEVGKAVSAKYNIKSGDHVFGCTRLGSLGYSTGQEYFLMDAAVAIPKPKSISLAEAATLGVAAETGCLAMFRGLQVKLPDPTNLPEEKDEWIVILGGATSVGKFTIQLARACGYKVVASCSNQSGELVAKLGAAHFRYQLPIEQQVKEVMSITGGNFSRIFETTATDNPVLAKDLFKVNERGNKLFASTNDWSDIGDFEGGKTYGTRLSPVGRPEEEQLNKLIETYIPVIVGLVENGHIRPTDYKVIGEGGFEDVIKAYNYQCSGAAGSRKVVVKVQDK